MYKLYFGVTKKIYWDHFFRILNPPSIFLVVGFALCRESVTQLSFSAPSQPLLQPLPQSVIRSVPQSPHALLSGASETGHLTWEDVKHKRYL